MNPFIVDISPQQATKLYIAANCIIKNYISGQIFRVKTT
jgi:hypothetical protein